jgi:hypothetical protein
LSHVIFGEYCRVEHETSCSDAIVEAYVFYLFIEGRPEFTDVASDEYSAA